MFILYLEAEKKLYHIILGSAPYCRTNSSPTVVDKYLQQSRAMVCTTVPRRNDFRFFLYVVVRHKYYHTSADPAIFFDDLLCCIERSRLRTGPSLSRSLSLSLSS